MRLFLGFLVALLMAACGSTATPTRERADIPTTELAANPATANPAASNSAEAGGALSPTSAPVVAVVSDARLWKYVDSGWVSLRGNEEVGVFTTELRAFVITSQEELEAFQGGTNVKRSNGTSASLSRVDFASSVLIAAYYLWRPLQGDPLSVVGFSLDGDRADVLLELEDSPQGKKYPYLLAPMTMVAIGRSNFPSGAPVSFVFRLNGDPQATVVATVN